MVSSVQLTGRAAAASGVLMIAGVEGEWLFDPQRDDGTVTNMPVFALLLLTATAGFALLLIAVMGLRAQTARSTRPARIGALMTVAGAGLLVVFGLVTLVTVLAEGVSAGGVVHRLPARHAPAVGRPGDLGSVTQEAPPDSRCLAAAPAFGVAAFGALAIEPDPWHDISLTVMFAAWSALGVLLLRKANQPASERTPSHTACRVTDHSERSHGEQAAAGR